MVSLWSDKAVAAIESNIRNAVKELVAAAVTNNVSFFIYKVVQEVEFKFSSIFLLQNVTVKSGFTRLHTVHILCIGVLIMICIKEIQLIKKEL